MAYAASMTNQLTVTVVVVVLGLFALLTAGGSVWLINNDKPGEAITPIVTLCGTALGALGAMLVSTRVAQNPPQQEFIQQGPTPVALPPNVPKP